MKSINDYISEKLELNQQTELSKNNPEEAFNDWLEKEYGFEDLYSYFRDQTTPDVTKDNWKEEYKKALKNTPSNIIKGAEDAGLDPDEVCYQVFKDSYLR